MSLSLPRLGYSRALAYCGGARTLDFDRAARDDRQRARKLVPVRDEGKGHRLTGMLYGLARFCVRRRFVVLAVWLVVTVALVVVSHGLGDNTNDNLSLPGTDSQHATNVLTGSFPAQANGTSPIVLH